MDRTHAAHRRGVRRPAVVLPTGAGKTFVFSNVISERRREHAGERALILAHTTELVRQAADDARAHLPAHVSVGVVQADTNETTRDVISASVQTLRSASRRRQLTGIGLVVVDECHHATASTYRDVLAHFGCMTDQGFGRSSYATRDAVAMGVTATMLRGDGAALGDIWQEVVYSHGIADMIRDGYLVRPRGVRVRIKDLDLAKVRKSAGDYAAGALGDAIEGSLAPARVVEAWRERAKGRPTILFAPTVHAAHVFAVEFESSGARVGVVHGAQPPAERAATIEALSAGDIDVVCNCMVLTEGTNIPTVSCIVVARPTKSLGLYIQMVGRGLRLAPGKDDCILIDIVGASQAHDLSATPIGLFGDMVEMGEDDTEDDLDVEAEYDVDEPDGQGDAPDEVYADGPIEIEEVDLFGQSKSQWQQTDVGIWFVATPGRFIAVLPAPERLLTWDVVAMSRTVQGDSRWVARGCPDLAIAMALAEQDIRPAEKAAVTRSAAWRMTLPADSARKRAGGRRATRGMSAGEVEERIASIEASERIDPTARRLGLIDRPMEFH